MHESTDDADAPGVYAHDAEGRRVRVHLYQGGEYGLGDVVETFQLGRLEPGSTHDEQALVLTRHELRQLKAMADAYSFDLPEEFIEMCVELSRFAVDQPGDQFRFVSNF